MAKLSRGDLKNLVKECLIEILQEGAGAAVAAPRKKGSAAPKKGASRSRSRAKDNIRFESAVKKSAQSLTEDPIMQSIFADTAKTTLQEQYSSGTPAVPTADRGKASNTGVDPASMFEGASNWADLAFSDPKTAPKA